MNKITQFDEWSGSGSWSWSWSIYSKIYNAVACNLLYNIENNKYLGINLVDEIGLCKI